MVEKLRLRSASEEEAPDNTDKGAPGDATQTRELLGKYG